MLDPYKILHVSPVATDEEIKSAYRKLAKHHHPDVNPGKAEAERKFKDINEAYRLIGTEETRQKYKQGRFSSGLQEKTGAHQSSAEGLRDIFSSFFGGPEKGNGIDIPGEDYFFTLEIELQDAVLGAEKKISLQPGKPILLKIQPGVDTGTKLRLKGQGGPGIGKGKPGDAYIEIKLRPSKLFRREGANLVIEVPVTIGEVIKGGKIRVQTVAGSVILKIPPRLDTTKKLRLRNQGFPDKENNKRGDLLVELKVIMPPAQDQRFIEFIQEWESERENRIASLAGKAVF